MAIDTTLFRAIIPAATYAVGDKIPLGVIRGPAVVRDGYGRAVLKRVFCVQNGGVFGHVEIKNSNWVDSLSNITPGYNNVILTPNSSAIQPGHDCELQPNSSWDVTLVFDGAATIANALDVFAMIDIDYPAVQAIANPLQATGTPTSNVRADSIAVSAVAATTLAWTTYNVDILKAGYRYLMSSCQFRCTAPIGFLSISGAAGQNGLERIIPIMPNSAGNLRYLLDYSTPLVKGPFNINYLAVGTAGTETAVLEIDWVKK